MLDFTVWVVPFFAFVTAHPELSIDLTVVGRVQVDLIAVVALIVGLEALVAELAKADHLLSRGNRHLVELGLLLVRDC